MNFYVYRLMGLLLGGLSVGGRICGELITGGVYVGGGGAQHKSLAYRK